MTQGSSITAIRESVLSKINANKSQIKPTDVYSIRAAAGTKHTVSGIINLTFQIGGLKMDHCFYVIPNLMQNVVIGIDLLKKKKAFIDFVSNTLTFPDDNASCPLLKSSQLYIQAVKEIIITPKQNCVYEVKATNINSGDICILNFVLNRNKQLKFTKSVLKSRQNKLLRLPLINISNSPVCIKPHTVLAKVKRIKQTVSKERKYSKCKESIFVMEADCDIQFEIGDADITNEQKAQLLQFLKSHKEIFATSMDQLSCTTVYQYRIETDPSCPPVQSRVYRATPKFKQIIKKKIDELLQNKIIEPSNSPYSSPCLLVKKAKGTEDEYRLVIDHRLLNSITKSIFFHLVTIEDIIDSMGEMQPTIFSVVDCMSGFLQIPLSPESKPKTAFVTHEGVYQYNRMPFGLKNAPFSYQRIMQVLLRGISYKFCLCFIDDVIIFSKNYEDHIEHLAEVFRRFKEANIKLKPSKCAFAKAEEKYLGHIMAKDGIKTDPDKLKVMTNFPVPKNVKDIRIFLGLTGFYRRFLDCYSKLTAPLTKLLGKEIPYIWTEQCQQSFQTLKRCLTTPKVLISPDLNKEFWLFCDSSTQALGYILPKNGMTFIILLPSEEGT